MLIAADVGEASGGVADHIDAVAAGLRSLGNDVRVFWASDVPLRVPGPLRTIAFSLALGRRARQTRPSVLHAHSATGGLAHLLAPTTTTCVTTSHGDERKLWQVERAWWKAGRHEIKPWSHVLVPGLRLPLFTAAVRGPEVVIALHQTEAETYRAERFGPDAVAVVPNAGLPGSRSSDPMCGRVVYVGTWIWRKGSTDLVDAFPMARQRNGDLSLRLVGPGAEACDDFPVDVREHVQALGYLSAEGVQEQLRTADILVLPSLFEGMPLVVLDALAHGVPVVATDLPGTRAAVGEAGILVPPGDAAALADAMATLTTDRELRARLSARALEDSEKRTWQDVARLTADAYERGAAHRPRTVLGRLARLAPRRRTAPGTAHG